MASKFEPFEKTKTFDQLKALVRRYEGLNGKLTAIQREGNFTIATYNAGMAYPPARRVEIILADSDTAAPPDGYALVCRGTAWDAGREIKVIAARKKP